MFSCEVPYKQSSHEPAAAPHSAKLGPFLFDKTDAQQIKHFGGGVRLLSQTLRKCVREIVDVRVCASGARALGREV